MYKLEDLQPGSVLTQSQYDELCGDMRGSHNWSCNPNYEDIIKFINTLKDFLKIKMFDSIQKNNLEPGTFALYSIQRDSIKTESGTRTPLQNQPHRYFFVLYDQGLNNNGSISLKNLKPGQILTVDEYKVLNKEISSTHIRCQDPSHPDNIEHLKKDIFIRYPFLETIIEEKKLQYGKFIVAEIYVAGLQFQSIAFFILSEETV